MPRKKKPDTKPETEIKIESDELVIDAAKEIDNILKDGESIVLENRQPLDDRQIGESPKLTAQDILEKTKEDIDSLQLGKRETQNLLKSMKIITAIMLGKDRNKELAHVLDTDKSFASKQVNALEKQGLVVKEGNGKDVRYKVDEFNLMKFLTSKVVLKWDGKEEK